MIKPLGSSTSHPLIWLYPNSLDLTNFYVWKTRLSVYYMNTFWTALGLLVTKASKILIITLILSK